MFHICSYSIVPALLPFQSTNVMLILQFNLSRFMAAWKFYVDLQHSSRRIFFALPTTHYQVRQQLHFSALCRDVFGNKELTH